MDELPIKQEHANDLTHVLPTGLTSEEVNFVYNVEVLGLPARKAATMAGMPISRQVELLLSGLLGHARRIPRR